MEIPKYISVTPGQLLPGYTTNRGWKFTSGPNLISDIELSPLPYGFQLYNMATDEEGTITCLLCDANGLDSDPRVDIMMIHNDDYDMCVVGRASVRSEKVEDWINKALARTGPFIDPTNY